MVAGRPYSLRSYTYYILNSALQQTEDDDDDSIFIMDPDGIGLNIGTCIAKLLVNTKNQPEKSLPPQPKNPGDATGPGAWPTHFF